MSTANTQPVYSPIEPEDQVQLLAFAIAEAADARKACDIRILDVRGLVSYTDYVVVCHGTSNTHARAVAEAIRADLRDAGVAPRHVEGTAGGEWMLLDFFDAIAHVFVRDTRDEYAIESLFQDAPHLPFEGDTPLDASAVRANEIPSS